MKARWAIGKAIFASNCHCMTAIKLTVSMRLFRLVQEMKEIQREL